MFMDLVKKRRSTRKYLSDRVPRELIERCIEAATYAPTACNTQSWRFVVVEGDLKRELVEKSLGGIIVPNRFVGEAPAIVVIATDLDLVAHRIGGKVKGIDYNLIDAGIAGEHFVLQAAELDLGTCWIGWFDKKAVKRLLKLPSGWDVSAMLTIGYPAEKPSEKQRKRVDEVAEFRGGEKG
jgi:nitroreductase